MAQVVLAKADAAGAGSIRPIVADAETLRELDVVERQALASMAVRLGTTRLIDNLVLGA